MWERRTEEGKEEGKEGGRELGKKEGGRYECHQLLLAVLSIPRYQYQGFIQRRRGGMFCHRY